MLRATSIAAERAGFGSWIQAARSSAASSTERRLRPTSPLAATTGRPLFHQPQPFGRRQHENPRHPGAAPEEIAVLFDLGREPTWAAVMPLDRSQRCRRFLFLKGNSILGAGLIGTGTTGLSSAAGAGGCGSAGGVSRNGPEV